MSQTPNACRKREARLRQKVAELRALLRDEQEKRQSAEDDVEELEDELAAMVMHEAQATQSLETVLEQLEDLQAQLAEYECVDQQEGPISFLAANGYQTRFQRMMAQVIFAGTQRFRQRCDELC